MLPQFKEAAFQENLSCTTFTFTGEKVKNVNLSLYIYVNCEGLNEGSEHTIETTSYGGEVNADFKYLTHHFM